MAERMFLYFLATLLHSFDWRLPEGKKMDLTEKFGIVLKLKNPIVAIPTPRLSNPALYDYLIAFDQIRSDQIKRYVALCIR
ncbi:hypothetical protein POTOM_004515 [Populus tomentosa]|uniref:Uncharacterized protein n=1 Tax=Populus tomentosa TaxID=118781 RepID=A0A8X8AQN7_POPTO|nr:hypothetical protein POTOM_004515 [Populus tomentosa]